jgi:hypothetical protein
MLPLCFLIPQCHLLCEQYPHNLQAAARVQLQNNTKLPRQPSNILLCFKLNRLDNTWRKKSGIPSSVGKSKILAVLAQKR